VRRLEAQELDLDEALKLFEEGIERSAQRANGSPRRRRK